MRGMSLKLGTYNLDYPFFMPDATLAAVRSLDFKDLEDCGVRSLIMNVFHLTRRPGISTIKALGGLHEMSGWKGPIFTDSGGFQVLSMINENKKYGGVSDSGIRYNPPEKDGKIFLTPEKSVLNQINCGSDVIFCLDECSHSGESRERQLESVNRTIMWAGECKKAYDKILDEKNIANAERPLIFGVVQGGNDRDLRKRCAEELLPLGFDGFGFGGWPMDENGKLLIDMIEYLRELIPEKYPLHALGVGHPLSLVSCFERGYDIFDCSMPTKDARNGRLYIMKGGPLEDRNWYSYLYMNDEKHRRDRRPLSENCDCFTCANYSLGYLHHLWKTKEQLYSRLASIHNLRFMTSLTERLRRRRFGTE